MSDNDQPSDHTRRLDGEQFARAGSEHTPPEPTAAEIEESFLERRKVHYWERLDQLAKEQQADHKNLRASLNELAKRTDLLERGFESLAKALNTLAEAPLEASKLRFSTQALYTIAGVTVVLVGTFYFATAGSTAQLKSDLRNLVTLQQAKATADEKDTKIADMRYEEIKAAVKRLEDARVADRQEAARLLRQYDDQALVRDLRSGAKK